MNVRSRLAAVFVVLLVLIVFPAAGRAAVAFRNSSCASSANATVTLPVPAGVQAGDFLIASVAVVGGTASAPSGWTMIPELDTVFGAGTNRHQTTFWHVATASEPASYVFNGSTYTSSGGIAAYSGVDTSTTTSWRGATPAAIPDVVASSVNLPTVTSTVAGGMAVYAVGTWTTVTHTFSAAVTKDCTVGGSFSGMGLAHESVGTGATSQRVDSFGSSQYVAGQTMVLAPAVPCGGGGLGITPPTSLTFGSVSLTGTNMSASTSASIDVADLTGTAPGWHISLTSTTFNNGSATLPTSAATVTGASAAALTGQCSMPTSLLGYPIVVPAGTSAPPAQSIYAAQAGTGAGNTRLTLNFSLAVPANAQSGTYSSTWTFTIASGP